jgi:hypothetical protein
MRVKIPSSAWLPCKPFSSTARCRSKPFRSTAHGRWSFSRARHKDVPHDAGAELLSAIKLDDCLTQSILLPLNGFFRAFLSDAAGPASCVIIERDIVSGDTLELSSEEPLRPFLGYRIRVKYDSRREV